jgi:hypothetical protein
VLHVKLRWSFIVVDAVSVEQETEGTSRHTQAGSVESLQFSKRLFYVDSEVHFCSVLSNNFQGNEPPFLLVLIFLFHTVVGHFIFERFTSEFGKKTQFFFLSLENEGSSICGRNIFFEFLLRNSEHSIGPGRLITSSKTSQSVAVKEAKTNLQHKYDMDYRTLLKEIRT